MKVTLPLFLLLTLLLIGLKASAHKGHGLTWAEWFLVGLWGYMAHDTILGPFFAMFLHTISKGRA